MENDDGINREKSNLTIVIVERSFDVMTPLLHEFTYQAMMHDLLPLMDNGKYQYVSHYYVLYQLFAKN